MPHTNGLHGRNITTIVTSANMTSIFFLGIALAIKVHTLYKYIYIYTHYVRTSTHLTVNGYMYVDVWTYAKVTRCTYRRTWKMEKNSIWPSAQLAFYSKKNIKGDRGRRSRCYLCPGASGIVEGPVTPGQQEKKRIRSLHMLPRSRIAHSFQYRVYNNVNSSQNTILSINTRYYFIDT